MSAVSQKRILDGRSQHNQKTSHQSVLIELNKALQGATLLLKFQLFYFFRFEALQPNRWYPDQ